MKVLVTGGAGYIGSTLTPILLQQGHDVRVLDSFRYGGRSLLGSWAHPSFEFLRGDIRDKGILSEAVRDVDAVVHLAAIVGDPACSKEPDLARAVNTEASLSLIDESTRAGVERFVFASTCSNYGRMADSSQYADETWDLRPISLYAESKVAVEESILDLERADFCPTVLRFATVYGVSPRMRFDLTVNEFTLEIVSGRRLEVFGEQFWRPYVHVRDVGRAIALALDSPISTVKNQVFNVGSDRQNFQKQQLVELIRPHAPKTQIDYVHREEDPRDYRVSFSKIEQILGYETSHTIESGIQEVADMIRNGVIYDLDSTEFRN